LIDLHTHTNESDGTYSPEQLMEAAKKIGLEAIAITDHDTFAGYDAALPFARRIGIDLICGIELSTRLTIEPGRSRSVHMLGYFPDGGPSTEFRRWLGGIQDARRDRNARLARNLQKLGVDVRLEEAQALGRSLTGRLHFARVMLRKGFVRNLQDAFDRYLDESAPGYVSWNEPSVAEGARRIREGGGISSVAHAVRLGFRDLNEEREMIRRMVEDGLAGIEVYHSDHGPQEVKRYLGMARHYGLAVTGGSDFHGDAKPELKLGTGYDGRLSVPRQVLDDLRVLVRS
jgi:3',5'-nucleoside bisphosphate phosphatase